MPEYQVDWMKEDNGIYRPFSYTVNVACFDGSFFQRHETIFVRNENVGNELLKKWNLETGMRKEYFPRYEYKAG